MIRLLSALAWLVTGSAAAADVASAAPYRIVGSGFVTDDSHPERPFQYRLRGVELRLSIDPSPGEAVLEFWSGPQNARNTTYYARRGRIFQVDADGAEIDPRPFGDLVPATIAALHPTLVAIAMEERRDMVRATDGTSRLFAWNDELWTVTHRVNAGRGDSAAIAGLSRRFHRDRLGDAEERIVYERSADGAAAQVQVCVGVHRIAVFHFGDVEADVAMTVPDGNRRRDRKRVIAEREIVMRELAPGLHALELPTMNTRVFVAEFEDHLVVIEGAYNAKICDILADVVHEQFRKPVRAFAFSHIHAQYIGGMRSWVHEGATILATRGMVPLVEAIAESGHDLRPDALASDPQPLRVQVVDAAWRHEDATNELAVYNIESDHTADFLIFHFPRQRVLLTGDLLWYRPGQPLTGRSKKLCEAIEALDLDVERCYVTWPLDDRYGTKAEVSAAELAEGCGQPDPPAP